ncbi:hypothetical protein [Oscillibacter sp.]|uniref:hypothetical protein n=1 Tax=Oscillibacter sp. TaxID=1945593 RepID=UPI003FA761A4
MPYDFKKEKLYRAGDRPEIVTVPPANYVAVRGRGDPNTTDGAYQRALAVLYALAYTLKTSPRKGMAIPGFFDYVVPPLEASGGRRAWTAQIMAGKRTFVGYPSCACRFL